ncbi:MAG: hypothetical protein HY698_03340 [Deltaproteobacteria bacterium]|nr:hypothetical protein [Deltaproteobacteria bacterium]
MLARAGSLLGLLTVLAGCKFDPGGLARPGGDDAGPFPMEKDANADTDLGGDASSDAPTADGGALDGAWDSGNRWDARSDAPPPDAPPADVRPAVDAPPEMPDAAPPDGPPGCEPWPIAATNFKPCDEDVPVPTSSLELLAAGTYRYDTVEGVLTAPSGQPSTPPTTTIEQPLGIKARLLVVKNLHVAQAAVLKIEGSLPFILAVHGTASVAGTIDTSATGEMQGAPGGDMPEFCMDSGGHDGEKGSSSAGGGGGGGGAFGEVGSRGGDGHGSGSGNGGQGGGKAQDLDLSPLRGGCVGGDGGDATESRVGGDGGPAGGAVQISASSAITVTGTIKAAGAGGKGGIGGAWAISGGAGGGGGGSGGAIFLEAPSVTVAEGARLCANGGSGGEGSVGSASGNDGTPGSCSATTGATTSRSAIMGGGDGGFGGYGAKAGGGEGDNGSMSGGGGAGGGSVGRIRIRATKTASVHPGAVLSPGL